jgi:hypothetical protein
VNDNDELESIWKDVLLIKMGLFLSTFLEGPDENKKNRSSCVLVRISRIQLYRAEAAHTVQGDFVVISGLILRTIKRGSLRIVSSDKFERSDHKRYLGPRDVKCNIDQH